MTPLVGLVVIAVVLVTLLGIAGWIAYRLLHVRRAALTRTPGDYGLEYEAVTFPSTDGLALQGWWVPARAENGTAVLCHPMSGNRQGLAGAGLDLLAVAAGLHQAGYAALLFDFRGHGESPASLCSGGLSEDQDVAGAVEYAFERLKDGPARSGVIGFGMGATAAIAAIGRQKGGAEVIRVFNGDMEGGVGYIELQPPKVKQLCFLVAVQPAGMGTLARGYLRQKLGFPGLALFPLIDWLCQAWGGYPLRGEYLLKYAREVHVPTLMIQARQDALGGCGEIQRIYAAVPGPKQVWWIEEAGRREGYATVAREMERVVEFMEGNRQRVT